MTPLHKNKNEPLRHSESTIPNIPIVWPTGPQWNNLVPRVFVPLDQWTENKRNKDSGNQIDSERKNSDWFPECRQNTDCEDGLLRQGYGLTNHETLGTQHLSLHVYEKSKFL